MSFNVICTDDEVEDDQRLLFGLPFGLECLSSFHTRQKSFSPAFRRVLRAVYCSCKQGYGHTPSSLVVILSHLMLHFLDEWEVFAVLSHLMRKKAWLNRGESEVRASQLTLLSLLQSHAVSERVNILFVVKIPPFLNSGPYVT